MWFATLEKGVPYNCDLGGGSECLPNESYPGFWEVPLYTTVEHENLMDYCTVEGDGSKVAGCSAYEVLKKSLDEVLKKSLDEAYDSNRGPVTVGTHKAYMKDSEFSADVGKFLDYALSKPDVWVVTHQQLLDWMEAPVPASQMKSFMAQYDCST
ncbi:G8 domain-containing isoform B [Chlorella sorokiniana]|uniref:G8 domain-containing isoform B n=1 Tax=Chlorella sorokiniana TaxID=3076 RepID=A0A2P6U0M6_CHLSO|nr:G8 domain-containing isoform B [Chlorella sorokiniana]|eukprot:PRW59866.1 G8 domain-containing isoform B [Chlorella sorokiniana]